MFTPPLRICYVSLYFCLLADYRRLANKIPCVQNNLSFAIKCFGYASRLISVLSLNSYLLSQYFLYYNGIFHFGMTLLCVPYLMSWATDDISICHVILDSWLLFNYLPMTTEVTSIATDNAHILQFSEMLLYISRSDTYFFRHTLSCSVWILP